MRASEAVASGVGGAGRRPDPTSLVTYHQTVHEESDPDTCPNPRPGLRMMHRETFEVRPVPCSRLACPACVSYLAYRRGLAIAYARPERRFDLTQVGDEVQEIRARMKRLRYDVANLLGAECEWVWMVEPNPAGTGNHVHGYQRGDFIPQRDLSRLAARRGMGEVVYIKRAESTGSGYGLKSLTYGMKGHSRAEAREMYLGLNGGRLTHQSRGYFGGPVREVESAAVAAKRGGDSPWLVGTVKQLHDAFHREPST